MNPPQPPAPPQHPGRKRRRGVALLPALFTLGNCLSGFAALNYASRDAAPGEDRVFAGHFVIAGYLIFLAMIFDMFDGFVARLTRSTSDFGAELDSLADVVSFGVAPAFLSVHLIAELLNNLGPAGHDYLSFPTPFSDSSWLRLFWIIAGIYVSCTALRLARFNVITQPDALAHLYFRGLPSPAAAAIVAGSVLFFEFLGVQSGIPFNVTPEMREGLKTYFPYMLPVMLLISALLMVSRFSYVHLVNRVMRRRKRFRTLVGFLLLGMVIVWEPQITVLVGIYVYTLSAPVMALYRKIGGKKMPGSGPISTSRTTLRAS